MTAILGIDPGLKGAYAYLDARSGRFLTASYINVVSKLKKPSKGLLTTLNAKSAYLSLSQPPFPVAHCFIEKPYCLPSQSTKSAQSIGFNYGLLISPIEVLDIPFTEISPQSWKRSMLPPKLTRDKRASCHLAAALFPDHKDLFFGPRGGPNDGLAEAALIALYGFHKLAGENFSPPLDFMP